MIASLRVRSGAVSFVVALLITSLIADAVSASNEGQGAAPQAWESAMAAVGVTVEVKLRSATVEGTIASATANSLSLSEFKILDGSLNLSGPSLDRVTLRREDIASIRGAETMRFVNATDVTRARASIEFLGVGKKVSVKTQSGRQAKGTIKTIASSSFTLDNSRSFSYAEVLELKRPSVPGWHLAVYAGIGVGAIIIAQLIHCTVCQ